MDVREFDFALPPELIAQEPPRERGGSRLLHLDRASGAIQHTHITAL
ncbi:MAG: S-adenosylmethionine:tRNA ribosyltransferase-isomerase, partial [Acidobacteria bacterium]|nr:S-adenosylmethionine:tRNA ribosyltransferase-isomerase [Acidobacteriota bacterium]